MPYPEDAYNPADPWTREEWEAVVADVRREHEAEARRLLAENPSLSARDLADLLEPHTSPELRP